MKDKTSWQDKRVAAITRWSNRRGIPCSDTNPYFNEYCDIIHSKAKNWKKIFVFLGKTGKNELIQASKNWDIKYKQRVSVTSSDSLVIEINKLKKKIN